MKTHLTHKFNRYPPALFENSVMRKTTKSELADPFDISEFQNPLFVVDGGNL